MFNKEWNDIGQILWLRVWFYYLLRLAVEVVSYWVGLGYTTIDFKLFYKENYTKTPRYYPGPRGFS